MTKTLEQTINRSAMAAGARIARRLADEHLMPPAKPTLPLAPSLRDDPEYAAAADNRDSLARQLDQADRKAMDVSAAVERAAKIQPGADLVIGGDAQPAPADLEELSGLVALKNKLASAIKLQDDIIARLRPQASRRLSVMYAPEVTARATAALAKVEDAIEALGDYRSLVDNLNGRFDLGAPAPLVGYDVGTFGKHNSALSRLADRFREALKK